jgi:hypothetical protein
MLTLSAVWLEIFSDLFVNLAAAWFTIIFIQPSIYLTGSISDLFWLFYKFLLGMLSLFIAKYFREEVKQNDRF